MHFKPVLELLEARDVPYSIGGSLLLHLKGLPVSPNDVDIIVERELFATAKEVLQERAVKYEDKPAQGRFLTRACTTFEMSDGLQVDLMTDFAVLYEKSVVRMPYTAVTEQTKDGLLPLGSMEAWYVMYWLLPGKESKRDLMEDYFHRNGFADPRYLKQALTFDLPEAANKTINRLLAAARKK
ncbi:hypothetical protein SAMN05421663_11617 [Terribacillus halophilus]|uniref:Nucleotidyl transferase AbiEii toxin, Type IV TA system n=1 Tax=Terribacillus halophilus TaxID=361279 RepID=A0A1G6WE36_9BACI|nr:hypothetical protein [Terribacillus halophilus]SDD64091.1 hypothetical protein SAMN05421663_11617 [Terribacillus halophilus]